MVHIIFDTDACQDSEAFVFTFASGNTTTGTGPSPKFCFDRPTSTSTNPTVTINRPFKRRRALSDVDGNNNNGGLSQRKKRRLRLQFITSRLSRPFSWPASNIVNRGRCKLALWGAKQHGTATSGAAGTTTCSVLRKAAIMNSMRRRMDAVKDYVRQQQEQEQEEKESGSGSGSSNGMMVSLKQFPHPPPGMKRYHETITPSLPPPLPRSPLGLSNYAALDLEDEEELSSTLEDEESSSGVNGLDRIASIYSDFNIMSPSDSTSSKGEDEERDGEGAGESNFAYLDALDGITSQSHLPAETVVVPSSALSARRGSDEMVVIMREGEDDIRVGLGGGDMSYFMSIAE